MKQSLREFVSDWNKSHNHFIFSVQEAPIAQLPISIEIRYTTAKYREILSATNWQKLRGAVEIRSHGTMHIVTDEHLFEHGIIEIKIGSMNHNYQEHIVVGVLRWIGEEFFYA